MTTTVPTSGPADAEPPVPMSPVDREGVRRAVDEVLAEFLAAAGPVLLGVGPDLGPVHSLAADYLAGGKRLRPAFCYWGWRATGAAPDAALIRAAASLELLQACALVHDDVMDRSDTRRGRPSAHRQFEAHHRASRWLGDHEQFGSGAAILLGDLFLTWSDDLFATSGVPAERLDRGRPLFATMRTELMAGQYLDLVVQSRPSPARRDVESVLRYKSAKYTIERPLQLGALLAGGSDRLVAQLGAFGLPLGEAFQLRDDVLGVFGDPAATGKPAGDDLREGKQTLLVALAAEAAPPAAADRLRAGLGDPGLSEADVEELRSILRDSGALAAVEQRIAELTTGALAALAQSAIHRDAREALGALAEAATQRTK
jgi:geranylgeranyl diphosphate synthase type I